MKLLKKGAATFLAFTISLVMMLFIFIYALSIAQVNIGKTQLEFASEAIARDLVVCSSLEEAQKLAKKETEEMLGGYGCIKDAQAVVALAGTDGWERGGYIYLFMSADVAGLILSVGTQESIVYTMIEHTGGT